MRPADRLSAGLREAEVLHLALGDELLDRAGDVLDRHGGVDAVLVEQVDAVGLQALQGRVGHRPDALWPAVLAELRIAFSEPELGGDHDLVAYGRQGLAQQRLVGERPIGLGGVEEGDAALDRRAQQPHAVLGVRRRAVAEAQSHAAKADG